MNFFQFLRTEAVCLIELCNPILVFGIKWCATGLCFLTFALTINDLEQKCDNSRHILVKYADDICLLRFLRCDEDDHLQSGLDNVFWSSEDGLSIN